MERFAKVVLEELNSVLETPIQLTDLEIPPEPELGDFAFPCFRLAKTLKKAPPQIAQDIANRVKAKGGQGSRWVQSVGPYVNFTVPPSDTLKALLSDILKGKDLGDYGSLKPDSRGTWVLEYSSPNVAKPLNIYHLRPTALGAALDRIGRYRGYRVISINHLGDWGKQYGMLTVAFRKFGIDPKSDVKMKDLVDMYVRINAEAEKDPTIEEKAKQAFVDLEKGDPEITALWQKCVDVSIKEFEANYKRMGVKFDHIWGESYYKDQLAPLIAELKKMGLLVESEGAWVVPLTDENGKEIPPCIIQKSDGATIYATRDVAAALYRFKKFGFERMTYIVGQEQKLHFKQIFGVLKKMGLSWADRCEHVPFGLYRFKDAKMSTRKGNFVTLEEVLELTKQRVTELMKTRDQERPVGFIPGQFEETTEKVAMGAVVFADLHSDPARDVEFDLDRVVDFEGETGPYLQYAHTRCKSILRKAQEAGVVSSMNDVVFQEKWVDLLVKQEELRLIKVLGQFPLHLERTLGFSKASQLAHYLIDVTKVFGAFYRECQVLGDSAELTQARLMLVEATRRVLARGLGLLGIPLPEKM
ncbi:MAG: arginine--tRNA ligase [Bdellovibrio sp.]|nr:arginine--tRNA ligase [Bdellovibrio sp.]